MHLGYLGSKDADPTDKMENSLDDIAALISID